MFSPFQVRLYSLISIQLFKPFDTTMILGGRNVNNEILGFVNDADTHRIFVIWLVSKSEDEILTLVSN